MQTQVITLSIPSRLELLPVLDRLMQGINDEMGFDEDIADAVSISVIEAGTNAIQHGHKRDASKIVEFRFDLTPDALFVTVHDFGPGFDLEKVLSRNPVNAESLMNCSGRGIFIMREMMDKVEFEIRPSAGTTVRLTKSKRSNGSKPAGAPGA
jgi:serine/threonine-protein kinase RsbW